MKNKSITWILILAFITTSFIISSNQIESQNNAKIKTNLEIIFGRPIVTVENMYLHKIDVIVYGSAQPISGCLLLRGSFDTLSVSISARDNFVFKPPRPIGFGIVNYVVHILCDFIVDNPDLGQRALLLGSYMIPL